MFFGFMILSIFQSMTRLNVAADCTTFELQEKLVFSNSKFSLFSTLFSQDVYYSSIKAVNARIETIPPYTFSNFCINALDISTNQIGEITSTSFSGIKIVKSLILSRNRLESIDGLLDTIDGEGLWNLNKLDLSINRIKQLTKPFPVMFSDLNELYLNYNLIEFISNYVFFNLPNLKYLYMKNNLIRCLTSFMFSGLLSLSWLDLNTNQIEEIKEYAFQGLTNLQFLDLSNNELVYLNESTFDGLKKLNTLYLNSNKLKGFNSRTFSGLNNLYLLKLSKNFNLTEPLVTEKSNSLNTLDLEYIPMKIIKSNQFIGFERVSILGLAQAKIDKIEDNAFINMQNLLELHLEYNKITSLSNNSLDGLSRLLNIFLNNNIISQINANMFQPLLSVDTINLQENLLRSIPVGLFSNLSSLKHLYLQSNQISIIQTASFKNMSNLVKVSLFGNEIVTIEPDTFQDLPSLITLDLSFNKLTSVRNFFFSGLVSLKNLILKGNGINSIEKLSFSDLINIETIDLEDNYIISIDSNGFESLQGTSVVKLNINKNQIDKIEPEMFSKSKIKYLSFQKNNLNSLTSQSLKHLVKTKELDFSLNKIEFIANDLFGDGVTSQADKLVLSRNQITSLSFLIGCQFSLVYSLDVSFNRLETLEYVTFKRLVNLQFLKVSNNPIFFIENGFFDSLAKLSIINLANIPGSIEINHLNIYEIDLSNCKNLNINFTNISNFRKLVLKSSSIPLSSIPFSQFSSINYLDLSQSQDDGFFTLDGYKPELHYLYLNQMKITSIEKFRFSQFESLYELYLADNEISLIGRDEFPANLHILDLRNNRIAYIDINSFGNINKLNLKNNRIKMFWTNSLLDSLYEIDLSNNLILDDFLSNQVGFQLFDKFFTTLSLEFNSLETRTLATISSLLVHDKSNLENLNISNNKITEISNECLYNMDALKNVNLASNMISQVGWSTFLSMDRLEWLNLGNNSITILEERTFSSLMQLKYLNLSHNNIEYIGSLLFAQLFAIQTLDLSSNRLKLIGEYSFSQMSLLEDLHLEANSPDLIFQKDLFKGLDSIVNLFVSLNTLSNEKNAKYLMESLHAQLAKYVINVAYFKSINIIHEELDRIDKSICLLVLEFVKKNIQVNLRSDFEMILFFESCQMFLYLD